MAGQVPAACFTGFQMPDLSSIVSIARILELPWYVGIPGLAIIVLLVWSALLSILRLKPVNALVSLFFALVVAIILSQAGSALVQLVGGGPSSG